MKLFDLLKAPGWGRRVPFRATAVWVAEPATRAQAGVHHRRGARPPSDRRLRSRGPWDRSSTSSLRPRPGDDARARSTHSPDCGRSGESEAHLFFGRSAHVDELLAELARSRFVAVMGASASGKSSLVNAGVLPALHGGFVAAGGVALADRVVPARGEPDPQPRPRPRRAGGARRRRRDPVIAAAQVEATLRRSAFGLADAVRQSPELGDGRVLVVVDQFEELFRFQAPASRSRRSTADAAAVRAAPHRGDAETTRRPST